jgi:hypothetical protein
MAKLNPRLYFETYMAYGFKDERWKGFGALTYNLGKTRFMNFLIIIYVCLIKMKCVFLDKSYSLFKRITFCCLSKEE